MSNCPVIAIDGPAASGKGTLSRKIADILQYAHMDTGALYRAVAFEILNAKASLDDKSSAIKASKVLKDKIIDALVPEDVLGNPKLRSDEIGQAASKIAVISDVRAILLDIQRDFAQNPGNDYKGAVLDGRDIGTIVCPDAHIKLFITASVEIRAQRRTKELQLRGLHVTYEAVLKDMSERDARDLGRKTAPMKPASDAIVFDTSELDPAETLEKALDIIVQKISA